MVIFLLDELAERLVAHIVIVEVVVALSHQNAFLQGAADQNWGLWPFHWNHLVDKLLSEVDLFLLARE